MAIPVQERGADRMSELDVRLECYFDCSSPFAYLGFHGLEAMASRLAIEVQWKPILVGGVFNEVNRAVYDFRASLSRPDVPRKVEYLAKDLQDWASFYGLTIHVPPNHPINSVRCMRACIVLERVGLLPAFARAAFEALWADGLDLSTDDALIEICRRVGVETEFVLNEIETSDIKDALRRNTDELIERNGFGTPTFFVDGDQMYFGNDRLPLVEAAVHRLRERCSSPLPPVFVPSARKVRD